MKPQERRETVTRLGRAHTVTRPAERPAAPRDWDLVLLRGELVLAGLLSLVTVAWSTVSIGGLLGGTWAAYGGALVFDTAWLAVMGLGWLARYQPDRRARAERVGLFLLLVSMAVITYHGQLHGSLGQGAAGAGIALGAKLLWSTVIGHLSCELDPDTQAWVDAEHREAHAMLATATVHRQSDRSRGQAAAHRLAVEARYGVQLADEHQVQHLDDEHQVLDVQEEPEARPWDARDRREVLERVAQRAVPTPVGAKTPASVRRMPADSPETAVSAQVTEPDAAADIRPDSAPTPAAKRPLQRPSARAIAHGLAWAGMDAVAVRQTLGSMGLCVTSETVERYVREARQQPQQAEQPGTGWYA